MTDFSATDKLGNTGIWLLTRVIRRTMVITAASLYSKDLGLTVTTSSIE